VAIVNCAREEDSLTELSRLQVLTDAGMNDLLGFSVLASKRMKGAPYGSVCWTTDHYLPGLNLSVGISVGCFIFDLASLPLAVARPI